MHVNSRRSKDCRSRPEDSQDSGRFATSDRELVKVGLRGHRIRLERFKDAAILACNASGGDKVQVHE